MGLLGFSMNEPAGGADRLPRTRKEQFYDILKMNFWLYLGLGVMVLLCSAPLYLSTVTESIYTTGIQEDAGLEATEEQMQAVKYAINRFQNRMDLINVGLLMLFAIPFSGLLRVIRQFAWGESVSVFGDMKQGIGQNWLQTVLMAAVGGLLYTMAQTALRSFLSAEGEKSYFLLVPMALFVLQILPLVGYMCVSIPIYSNSFRQNVRLAFRIFSRCPMKSIAMTLFGLLFYLPQRIPNYSCQLWGWIVSALLTPVIMLKWTLFAYEQMDAYINPQYAPELIGRGLHPAQEAEKTSL